MCATYTCVICTRQGCHVLQIVHAEKPITLREAKLSTNYDDRAFILYPTIALPGGFLYSRTEEFQSGCEVGSQDRLYSSS